MQFLSKLQLGWRHSKCTNVHLKETVYCVHETINIHSFFLELFPLNFFKYEIVVKLYLCHRWEEFKNNWEQIFILSRPCVTHMNHYYCCYLQNYFPLCFLPMKFLVSKMTKLCHMIISMLYLRLLRHRQPHNENPFSVQARGGGIHHFL